MSARRGAASSRNSTCPHIIIWRRRTCRPSPPFFTAQLLVRLAEAIHTDVPATRSFADALEHQRLLELIEASAESGQRKTVRTS